MNVRFALICAILFLFFFGSLYAQLNSIGVDSTAAFANKFTIRKHRYVGYIRDSQFFITRPNGSILIKMKGDYNGWELKDVDGDGFKDILVNISGNTPAVNDLLLFLPAKKNFKKVGDFSKFPDAHKIAGTKYYYSYHKSGCADMNWDSDLFYINNHHAIRIGNIYGEQCSENGDKEGKLLISRINGVKKRLVETKSSKVLSRYKENKWGFLKAYWSKNYRLF